MKNSKVILGSMAGFGLFALALVATPVLAHGFGNGSSVRNNNDAYRYHHANQNYDDCPMHEGFERRATNQNAPSGYGYHRGMMGRF